MSCTLVYLINRDMSYVIQNFYDSNKKVSFTPRFKFLLVLNQLNKFFIFLKVNSFLNLSNKINLFNLNYLSLFFKYFFSKQYTKIIINTNLSLIGNYTNNLTKSYIFSIFFSLLKFFKSNNLSKVFVNCTSSYLYNLYFFSVKTLNTRINNTFYKNIFFYFMLINPFIWYQHSSNLKFYLNFIFVNYTLRVSRFYNGHFLRVYSY